MSSQPAKPVVVIGDGWAALGTVGFLVASGVEVNWVPGTEARIFSPLASLETGPGVRVWTELATKLGITCGEPQTGNFVREFKNKAFRAPPWAKGGMNDEGDGAELQGGSESEPGSVPKSGFLRRTSVRDESLWRPERGFVGAIEARFSKTLGEIEEEIREALLSRPYPNLRRFQGIPITGFRRDGEEVVAVQLGSGDEIECGQVIYADRWSLLTQLEGLPRPIDFLRKREPMGVLQANFKHEFPVGEGVSESFYAPIHREAGEEVQRHVWGYFSSDGRKSTWTVCLTPDEVENNHEIAKKLRRLKSSLDKVFAGSNWVRSADRSFGSTIVEEQVRFVEEWVFSEGQAPVEPLTIPKLNGILFLTDGYGPSSSFLQVGSVLGV